MHGVRVPPERRGMDLRMFFPEAVIWLVMWLALGWVHSLGLPIEFA